jgi:hypothetical protein
VRRGSGGGRGSPRRVGVWPSGPAQVAAGMVEPRCCNRRSKAACRWVSGSCSARGVPDHRGGVQARFDPVRSSGIPVVSVTSFLPPPRAASGRSSPARLPLAPSPFSREPTATGGWVRGCVLLLETSVLWVTPSVSLFRSKVVFGFADTLPCCGRSNQNACRITPKLYY